MSRSFLILGVVATVWAIGITLADKTPSQAAVVKQRGDQAIKTEEYAEDDLVAPSIETEIFTSKQTPDTKKNEVEVTKEAKDPRKPPSFKKYHTKYSPPKKSHGKHNNRFRQYPSQFGKSKQVRPPRRQTYRASPKPVRENREHVSKIVVPEHAQRRDSSYGAPAAPQPKVIIKQAGPSKQYAWVGHQHYHNPGHDVPGHVFGAANIPKWTLMGSNIFQANLLYPGNPNSASSPAKNTYQPPAPAAPSYDPPQPAGPSYSPPEPAPAYNAPAPVAPSYNPPAPAAPAYNSPAPAPAQLSYDAPAPVYNSAPNPFIGQSQYGSPSTTAAPAPPPVYQPSASPASVYVGQPSYVPSYPSIQYVPAQPTPAAPTPAPTPAYSAPSSPAPSVYNRPQPNIYNQFANNFPTYSALPQTQSPILPAVSSGPANVYNVPIKVEETPSGYGSPEGSGEEGDEVFYIFYEDKKPEASYEAPTYQSPPTQNDISSYIVEDVQASKAPSSPSNGYNSQFNAPNANDIRTVYVPFENAVNIPANAYDVNVASSFGYTSGAPSQQAGSGAVPPNYSGFPNFPVTGASASPPSYDSSISSYDAPILDDNSYTAKNPINLQQPVFQDSFFYQDTVGIKQHDKSKGAHLSGNRPVRNLRLLPAYPEEQNTPSKSLRTQLGSASEGTKTLLGKYSFKLLPGKSNLPYGTRLGPRKPYDIALPGL